MDYYVVLQELEETIKLANGEILLAENFNAHSNAWGEGDIDQRG